MPKCRNCQKTISKQDQDLCPYCGTPHPVDPDYKTQDITEFIDPLTGEYKLYESKRKSLALLLSCLAGPFGACFFYLNKKIAGIISLIVTILMITAGVLLTVYVYPLSILFFILADYLFHIIYGLYLGLSHAAKDGNGEFLR